MEEQSFKCNECSKLFQNKDSLKSHSRYHKYEKRFKCVQCGAAFKQNWHLQDHERTHTGEKPFACEHCPKTFSQRGTLLKHRRLHSIQRPYKCRNCAYSAKQKINLTRHKCTHAKDTSNSREICRSLAAKVEPVEEPSEPGSSLPGSTSQFVMDTSSQEDRDENITSETASIDAKGYSPGEPQHGTTEVVPSSLGLVSKVRSSKDRQIVSNADGPTEPGTSPNMLNTSIRNKVHKCETCTYSTMELGNLLRHQKTHTGERPFKCKLCNYTAIQKSHFIRHQQIHDKQTNMRKDEPAEQVTSPIILNTPRLSKVHKCETCTYSTTQPGNFSRHQMTHTGERPFKCKLCDYSAIQKSNFIRHQQTHGKQKNKRKVQDRSQIMHYNCRYCSKSFDRGSSLGNHMKIHTQMKVYQCRFCDVYSTTVKQLLRMHEKTHESKPTAQKGAKKQLICHYCSKSFNRNSQLIIHVRSHTGVRPFKCRFCKHATNHRGHLNVHERIHTKSATNFWEVKALQGKALFKVKLSSIFLAPFNRANWYSICKICKLVAETEAEIVSHMNIKHKLPSLKLDRVSQTQLMF